MEAQQGQPVSDQYIEHRVTKASPLPSLLHYVREASALRLPRKLIGLGHPTCSNSDSQLLKGAF
ncbi:MAG: hypothetical protein H8E66_12030 [Planctomycetes bacterium]|nr:hypothetical protein [Planctomycetota bacterium]